MSRWLIRAAVSLVVAAILFTFIPLHAVVDAIGRISVWTWLSSLAVFFAGHYLNAVKLRILLGPGAVPLSSCIQAQYAGLVANLGLPGLAGGDLVRAAYLIPSGGAKRVAFASIVDRVLDMLTLVALVVIAAPVAGVPEALRPNVPGVQWMIGALALGSLTILALSIALRTQRRVAKHIDEIVAALRERRTALVSAAAISLSVQAAFVLTNAWMAQSVGVTTPIAAWFVAWPLSKLIAVLPISLGGLGVREAALVSLLVPYGAPSDAVLASGILWQTVLAASGLAGLIATQWIWRPASNAPGPIPKANPR